MDFEKEQLTKHKFRLPYHWIRDPLSSDYLIYFGYLDIVRNLLKGTCKKIADFGSGDGRITAALVEDGHDVVGFEYFSHLVEYSKVLVPEAAFHQIDLTKPLGPEWDIHSSSFDAVISIEVYEHLPPDKCPILLDSIKKLLKSDGIAIISVPSHLMPLSKLHYRHFTLSEIRMELSCANFEIINVVGQLDFNRYRRSIMFNKFVEKIFDNKFWRLNCFFLYRQFYFKRKLNISHSLDTSARYIFFICKEQ